MHLFPALLPPLLTSQLSAMRLATMLARPQSPTRLGRGTAPGAGARGIGHHVLCRGLRLPSHDPPSGRTPNDLPPA